MELARVLTQLSNAPNNSSSASPNATFSDAMATHTSFLQPHVAATHSKRARQRKAGPTIAASDSTGDESDKDDEESEPPCVTSQRRRQRDRKKQQQRLGHSAAGATSEDDEAPARSEQKYVYALQLEQLHL